MSPKPPILVLLHPFPMDASFWGPTWRELGIEAALLTPEFPGFGGAPAQDAPSVDGFADEVAALIRTEGGAATVVGLSLGGYVALSLAARHPDAVAGLVLANTRAEADGPEARRAREQSIDTIRIDGIEAFLPGLLDRLLGPSAPSEAWERAQAIAGGQDPEAVCAALEALRDRADRSADLAHIAVPTVVVVGSDDVVTPLDAATTLSDGIPGATLEVLDGAGHLSALEQPAAFADVVRRLLDRVRAAPRPRADGA